MGNKRIQEQMNCPQCKTKMEKKVFDVGYGVNVDSFNCKNCGFNITDEKKLNRAMNSLREKMSKQVKIVRIGNGLGLRFPNTLVENYNLKKGGEILLLPEEDGIKLVT